MVAQARSLIDLAPLGDRAFLARFAAEAEAAGWAAGVRAAALPGVVDVVLAYRGVAVFADPDRADLDDLDAKLRGVAAPATIEGMGRLVRIPVLYDGDDLAEVASRTGHTEDGVIALHAGREYRVLAVGFLPGFPYAGDLAPGLRGLARRPDPRPRVPSGSVAIVGRQTGVYPQESPGGWHLIGRTPLRISDPAAGHFPIAAGDRLRFEPVTGSEFRRRFGELLS